MAPSPQKTRLDIPLLEGLSPHEISRVLSAGQLLDLTEGDLVVRAGQQGSEMFLLLSGSVRVESSVGGTRQVLAHFQHGQIFGEIAFVSSAKRTADVVAAEQVQVLALSRPYLEHLLQEMPAIAARLLFNLSLILCERLVSTTRSWMDSEYENTLILFQTLANETDVESVFSRFAAALCRALPRVQSIVLFLGDHRLSWPDDAPAASPPPAAWLAELTGPVVERERSRTICPVLLGQRPRGYVLIAQETGHTPGGLELDLVSRVSSQLGLVLDRLLLHEETKTQATTDPLTGLFNRLVFSQELATEIARAERYRNPLSLIVADLDHFKRVNDTHGHLAGDATLRAVASCCSTLLRRVDIPCRYGGEEFAILLPMTDLPGAEAVAERLRAAVEQLAIPFGEITVRITVSLGVATFRSEDGPEEIIRRADEALYAAKAAGRNRVTVAPGR